MNITKISDSEIIAEYVRRFQIPSGEVISSSTAVANHLRSFIPEWDVEHFIVIYLNSSNKIITTEILFSGTISSAIVFPREVIKKVLEHKASAVIIAHNHPSGNMKPSREDRLLSEKLIQALKHIDVLVHDNIIICNDNYYSFADNGQM